MKTVTTSNLEKFYKKTIEERLDTISMACHLSREAIEAIQKSMDPELARILDSMTENVIGAFPLPLGVATNFIINGKERLVTMATEEPSVVAAASNAARMARPHGGFTADPVTSIMIGQVQLVDVADARAAIVAIKQQEKQLLEKANEQDPLLVKAGGGARHLDAFNIETSIGPMVDVHLLVDCLDAMGANAVNTMVEKIAPLLGEITGGRPLLRIISNLAVHRVARARATFDKELLGGADVVSAIVAAVEFAGNDMYRAVTHNKGIMNGASAVVLATGNDTRAVEAGAHAYAAWGHPYKPLTRFMVDAGGNLAGEIELPVAVGIIGGATRTHPIAQLCLKIMEIDTAQVLSQVIASVGLAQNLAALRALVSEGIQQGHMKLHAKNVVRMAGIPEPFHERVIELMVARGKVRVDIAAEIYKDICK
ncbi:MAG: hydroxymethylglutaryl-CoA reductase, degradative [Candidatus Lokiarchaeota archaeon]|nr:hydroxymethylglutaryl-CoA reductase, degradative [Candidatus Lokiarchaeota archaeon]